MATRIYKTPFAATGDKEALATADQPDGKVSLQAGWTPDYELPNDNANYRPVGRAEMNGIIGEITEGLGEIQLNGFAKWQPVDGGWPLGAQVCSGDTVYRSEVNGNTTDPGAGGAGWIAMPAGIATLVDANDATNNTRAVTPAGLRAFIGGRPGRLKRVRVYDTVGIELYSASTGTQAVFVEVQGGGGSGGSTPATPSGQSAVAGGGGGGGYCSSWLTSGFNGVIITVGQGGAPVPGGGSPGNPGGLSSFGSLLSASGGSGGSGAPNTASAPIVTGGGSGGGSSGGNVLNALGGQAHSSFALSNGTSLNGGAGGSSHLGGGGGQTSAGNQPGNAGLTYGAGGSGCATGQNQAATNGGRGFKGAVIVWEYE